MSSRDPPSIEHESEQGPAIEPAPPANKLSTQNAPTPEEILNLECHVSQLRSDVSNLQHQLLCLRQLNKTLGDSALTMPEDLGEWEDANPRISGLVNRIRQTYHLSEQVQSLRKQKRAVGWKGS
ncbi:unnamed protein product [Agarophyton chilense]